MKKHAAEVSKAVDKIIRNSASGQLRRGDTLGMWTFNTDVYSGQYALQTWLPDNLDEISLLTEEFLKQQKYGKASRFDLAMSGVLEVVKNSDIITVIIISTGDGKAQGTPFDDDLNALYKQIQVDNRGSHLPVATVLQGKGGKLIRYTANMLPWPVVIPEVPIAVKVVAPAPVTTPPATTPPVQQPLPIAATTPTAIQPATITPAGVTPTNTVPQQAVNPLPTPVIVPPPSVQPAITPATAPPEAHPPNERANMQSRPVNAPLSAAPGPPPSQPDAIAASEPVVQPAVQPVTAPPIRQAPTGVGASPSVVPKPEPVPPPQVADSKTAPKPVAPRAANTNATKAQTAAAVPGTGLGNTKTYLIAGVAMLLVAVGLIARMVIRGRAYRPSLISNTMGGPPKR